MDLNCLDEEQRDTLKKFQEISNIQDQEIAYGTLASLNWNLERAIETHLLNEIDDPHDNGPEIEIITPPRRSPIQPLRNIPIRQEIDSNRTVDMDTDDQDNTFNIEEEEDEFVRGPTFHAPHRFRNVGINQPSSSRPVQRGGYMTIDSDDDIVSFDQDDVTNRADAAPRSRKRTNGEIPLIPEDSGNISEALTNFVSVFESRYCSENGAFMPYFSTNTLPITLREAFDAANIAERKPLALYVHNDKSVAANIFATNIMCRDEVSSLLRHQFVLWGWDVTSRSNKEKLVDWLKNLNISENRHIFETLHYEPRDRYPLLVLLIKEKGTIRVVDFCDGTNTPDQVMEKLIGCIEEHTNIRMNERQEQANREERERIRQEQAEEYEKSLAADRARILAKEKEIREQKEEEERRIRAEEDEKLRRAKLESELPSEPAETEAGVYLVRFRMPEGEQLMRRFRSTDTLNILMNFLSSKGYSKEQYRFFNSDFPRKDISTWDANTTFSSLKFPPREQIFVEEQ